MTDIERRIDNAKKADCAAVEWRLRSLRKADQYAAASKEAKDAMEEELRQEVMHKRFVDGISAAAIEKELRYRESGGLYAQYDEAIWRQDDIDNGEVLGSDAFNEDAHDVASPESGWYELPGPSSWWPDNYDYRKHGFDVSVTYLRYQEALALVLNDFDEVPEMWD
ncbi:MAG: hypothetical protein M1813_001830 [Trichoglossum hirsutum]|nr:MAG: hypothetical protein M1813_001830 [Trichoglossum hirsutum]